MMRKRPPGRRAARMIRRWLLQRKETLLWRIQGSPALAPAHIKRAFLLKYLKANGLRVFVETGTLYGDTVAYLQSRCAEIHSIELNRDLFQAAQLRFADYPKVHIWHGDSGEVLADVLQSIYEPALFWLDGHYSGHGTARGNRDTPILRELDHIANHQLKTAHHIVIDDARLFDGSNGYPRFDEVCTIASELGFKQVRSEHDMIVLSSASSS